MPASEYDATTFPMRIGNLGLTLVCRDEKLYQLLAKRYRTYQSDKVSDRKLLLSCGFGSIENSRDYERLEFQENILKAYSSTYEGWLELESGNGRLVLEDENPVDTIDYFVRVVFSVLGFQAGGFLFHGAGIVHNEGVHVFFGYSGSGKSTIANLSNDKVKLSDDLVLIMPEGDEWNVHSTPFWNVQDNSALPVVDKLVGLYRLVKDNYVYLEPLSRGEAIAEMIASIPVVTLVPNYASQLIRCCSTVLSAIPCYRLHFKKDSSFWEVIDVERQSNRNIE
jgi:hypothetical protein